jgi:hypothetical protein
MKNPTAFAVAVRETGQQSLVVTSRNGYGSVPITSLFGDISSQDSDEKPDDKLTNALQELKFSEEDIARITELVATVAAMASVVTWGVAPVLTIKQVIALFNSASDPVQEALKALSEKLQQIYGYLANENKKKLYTDAIGWRVRVAA